MVRKTSSVTLTRTAPAGMTVGYPADGTSSGLNSGPALGVGLEDYAAVRLDATALKAGTYTATVKATWDGGSLTDDLKVVVA